MLRIKEKIKEDFKCLKIIITKYREQLYSILTNNIQLSEYRYYRAAYVVKTILKHISRIS